MNKTNQSRPIECAICSTEISGFFADYPGAVCLDCDRKALNEKGECAKHIVDVEGPAAAFADCGDNPVFIDGVRCWRRYRLGGWITMKDLVGADTEHDFFERQLSRRKTR